MTKVFRMLACVTLGGMTPLGAQIRTIDLTGAPARAVSEPFTTIVGVREVGPDRIITADRSEQRIVMIDLVRGKISPIGRTGEGPGEFRQPHAVLQGPGTETWITDPPGNRIHVVTAEGAITRTLKPPPAGGTPFMPVKGIDQRGYVYHELMGRPGRPGEMDSLILARWDPKAERDDSLLKIPSGLNVKIGPQSGGTFSVSMTQPIWGAVPTWAALPDGRLAIVEPSPYRVRFVSAGGAAQLGPVRAFQPIAVTAAMRDAYRKAQQPSRASSTRREGGATTTVPGSSASSPAKPIPDEDFPKVLPPFMGAGSLRVTPEGQLWVLRTRGRDDKTTTYDVFDRTGVLIARARLKPNSVVVGFGAGTVYVARQDPSDDLRYLEQYRR